MNSQIVILNDLLPTNIERYGLLSSGCFTGNRELEDIARQQVVQQLAYVLLLVSNIDILTFGQDSRAERTIHDLLVLADEFDRFLFERRRFLTVVPSTYHVYLITSCVYQSVFEPLARSATLSYQAYQRI